MATVGITYEYLLPINLKHQICGLWKHVVNSMDTAVAAVSDNISCPTVTKTVKSFSTGMMFPCGMQLM